MKTSAKVFLGVVSGFIAGCAAGIFFPSVGTNPDSAKGDIAKVSKFNKNVVNVGMSALEEELKNNPEELEKTQATLNILTSRMDEFDALVDVAVSAGEGTEELSSTLGELKSVQTLARNAKINGENAVEALKAISNGEKSEVDFEQASQNLTMAFLLVDRQVSLGKKFVCDVDFFLKNKNADDFINLAFARDLWANFCCVEAGLNDDKEELAYWSKQSSLVKDVDAALSLVQAVDQKSLRGILTKSAVLNSTFKEIPVNNAIQKGHELLKSIDGPAYLKGFDKDLAKLSNRTDMSLVKQVSELGVLKSMNGFNVLPIN